MGFLDKDVRLSIEEQIDNIYNNATKWEELIRAWLSEQGIEPNLETVLSTVVRLTLGQAYQRIEDKFGRAWTKKEAEAISALLKRRAFELRHRFLSTRIVVETCRKGKVK
ncbi:MAG: hypothetical protein AOA65_0223 [Candidatus Bathyarchaeota archaeon BA1]|nr:MAG: hypothetical protein AOA65_0223 [Candidatus Bathyarchaeota archaeon BA1]